MTLPIVFLPEARAEYDEAAQWYEQRRPGLGKDFIAKVRSILDLVAQTPRMHAPIFQDVRRAPIARFPYGVFYQVEPSRILVVAVFHAKRDPSVWQRRV
jgi:plasmid stabilization system protein ParE